MRFLIVDESGIFRAELALMLRERWPDAETDEWDPRTQGSPLPTLSGRRRGTQYSAVLLDSQPAGEDGVAWVAVISKDPQAPPVVLITQHGGEFLAVKAMKAGAADFLRKDGLTSELLVASVDDAMREHEAQFLDRTQPDATFMRTLTLDPRKIGTAIKAETRPVPGYRILRKIGEGGMAKVYLAERESDGMQLVLKILGHQLRADEVFRKRFIQEYNLIVSIENEHVAKIYDQGFSGEHPFIAMEYFPGGDLKVRLEKPVTALGALRIASQIAKALDAIHAHAIIHRDLKPQNILFRENGRLAIVDFGLAKDTNVDSSLTMKGELLATPRYMSPEQCMGLPVDARSDLYSLGVIFVEMLTGKRVFDAENPAGLIYQHVHGPIPQLPGKLAGYQPIVNRLLAKKPDYRFQSARDLFAYIAI
jgi:FixJ family two-component response regulator/tRNA A-37 threonylcarbamoyl transferase component Bud32